MTAIQKIRKEVTILANRINKKVKDLSASFRRAWQIIKGHKLISKIAGVTQNTRQAALKRLATYNRDDINVTLERESCNAYDANAVKVMVSVGTGNKYNLGYIPKDLATLLAPLLDKGIEIASRFISVTGGQEGCETYGGMIVVEL